MYVQAIMDSLRKRFLDLLVSNKLKKISPKYDLSDEEVCLTMLIKAMVGEINHKFLD